MKTSHMLRGVFAISLLATAAPASAISSHTSIDRNLTIIQTFEPNVRPRLGEMLPASGQVRILINVDDSGTLVDVLPVSYTHKAYYDAAAEALKHWKYEPAQVHGEPISVRQQIVFNFEARGQIVSLTAAETTDILLASFLGHEDVRCVLRGSELDSAPKPTKMVQPLWVPTIEKLQPGSGVLVDFYIDETGHPRMPAVTDYPDDLVAKAAVHALQQWEFTVPRYHGRPVAVRATQWFAFSNTRPTAE